MRTPFLKGTVFWSDASKRNGLRVVSRWIAWLCLLLFSTAGWAGGVVSRPTEVALRAAMAGGGKVAFACDGTITLTGTITNTADTLLDGAGRRITISGGDSVRIFYVRSNTTLRLQHVELAQGWCTNHGAGILNDYGTVIVTESAFTSNRTKGVDGPLWPASAAGGSAAGGAVANFGVMQLINCTFAGNSATGGEGSPGISGMIGVPGGCGMGGGVWNSGSLTAFGCTFYGNVGAGGKGGDGGPGFPVPWPNPGYPGGQGGDAAGAALYSSGTAQMVNCTIALNRAAGGPGGIGGPGYPHPDYPPPGSGPDGSEGLGIGAVYDASSGCAFTNCTLANNTGTGIATPAAGTSVMINTLLQGNLPANCLGAIQDLGCNLSSDSSCNFTNSGSRNTAFAALGALTNNGGPTLTMAPLPDNPAIDAGDAAVNLAVDQRGFPRPCGSAPDVGACEFGSVLPRLEIFRSTTGSVTLIGFGNAGQSCRISTSPDLTFWSSKATTHFNSAGTISLQFEVTTPERLFYRLVMP